MERLPLNVADKRYGSFVPADGNEKIHLHERERVSWRVSARVIERIATLISVCVCLCARAIGERDLHSSFDLFAGEVEAGRCSDFSIIYKCGRFSE